jgi:uncharacterized protein (DUF736 family)
MGTQIKEVMLGLSFRLDGEKRISYRILVGELSLGAALWKPAEETTGPYLSGPYGNKL